MISITLGFESDLKPLSNLISNHINPGSILHLDGPLGAGKTTFTRYLGEALNSKDHINSPSYGLIQSYSCTHSKIKTVHHMDFYRLENQSSIDHLDLERYIDDLNAISIIEWSSKWEKPSSDKDIHIAIKHLSESSRQLTFRIGTFNTELSKALASET